MPISKEEIQNKISKILLMVDVKDEDLIGKLNQAINDCYDCSFARHFVGMLHSDEWPRAADPMLICDSNSEVDKMVRASAVFSMFLASRLYDGKSDVSNKKVLDFGCGEGHLANQVANAGAMVVGYDIRESHWEQWQNKFTLTMNPAEVISNGPYDLIVLYDVLDHAENKTPIELLKQVKFVLAPSGKIVIRCHPWCSRHGTHMWSLNRAFAHVVFTEEELDNIGHFKGIHTIKVVNPDESYLSWFRESGLRIISDSVTSQQSGPIFENNKHLKDRVLSHYPGSQNISYNLIEQVWRDFCLEI